MFRNLLLCGALIAIADPVLLYFIYNEWGMGTFLACLLFPAIAGPTLIAFAKKPAVPNTDPAAAAGMLGDGLLLFAARFLFVYPGPISTLIGLLLLFPFVRRLIGQIALRGLHRAVASGGASFHVGAGPGGIGGMTGMGGMGIGGFGNRGGAMPYDNAMDFGASPIQGLKPAEGRVIEPDDDNSQSRRLDAPVHDPDSKKE